MSIYQLLTRKSSLLRLSSSIAKTCSCSRGGRGESPRSRCFARPYGEQKLDWKTSGEEKRPHRAGAAIREAARPRLALRQCILLAESPAEIGRYVRECRNWQSLLLLHPLFAEKTLGILYHMLCGCHMIPRQLPCPQLTGPGH